MDIFTDRFNEVIKNEKVVQSELANEIGIARQCITDYKSGKSYPTIQTLRALCGYLEVSSDYLLGLSKDDFGARTAAPVSDGLSSEERRLINQYRTLPDKIKKTIRDQIEIYSEPNELLFKSDKKV